MHPIIYIKLHCTLVQLTFWLVLIQAALGKRAAGIKTNQSLFAKNHRLKTMTKKIKDLIDTKTKNGYGHDNFLDLCVDCLFDVYDQKVKDIDDLEDVKILSLLYEIYKDVGGLEDE